MICKVNPLAYVQHPDADAGNFPAFSQITANGFPLRYTADKAELTGSRRTIFPVTTKNLFKDNCGLSGSLSDNGTGIPDGRRGGSRYREFTAILGFVFVFYYRGSLSGSGTGIFFFITAACSYRLSGTCGRYGTTSILLGPAGCQDQGEHHEAANHNPDYFSCHSRNSSSMILPLL